MRILISLLSLIILAGCSASTRYNVSINVASLIPADQRTQSFGNLSGSIFIPGSNQEGLLVPLPAVDIVEGGRIAATVQLANTGNSDFTGNYEIRMGPKDDNNINDNQGGDFGLGADNFTITPGDTQEKTFNIQISSTTNANVLRLIREANGFRIALRVGVNSSGGRVTLNTARVIVTARPFAAIK